MNIRWKTLRVALLVLPVLVAWTSPVHAGGLTQRLTAAEVACNAQQLDRLQARISTGAIQLREFQLPKTVMVTYSNEHGYYEGLALTNQNWRTDPFTGLPPPTPERYLSFHLNPSIRTLLLNPDRPPVGQISLGREQANSNLVTPGGPFDLSVMINPTLAASAPRQDLLEINNFVIPAQGEPYNDFLANSTKPGRGLEQDGLLTPCHNKLTDFDRHVFALLQRMLRTEGYIEEEHQLSDNSVVIFRGEEEHTYRFTIYPLGTPGLSPPLNHVAGELQLAWTPEGKITSGTMRVRPRCSGTPDLDCSSTLALVAAFLIPPVFGGNELWPAAAYQNQIYFLGVGEISGPATYDMEALLAGTDWNSPAP